YIFKEYSLDEIIRSSVEKFAGEFIDRKLTLNYEPVNHKVISDEKWLSFVVEQIISNALKYTKEGSITICMSQNDELLITDTGIGIQPEDLPRIFEKGYTGKNGRSDKSASGLGLYLCKCICANLNIDISATSVICQGTTVKLQFPENGLTKM
ncbi:MAG: sensor histidine kinase, partial [Oscillospiraceae bacterium]|nr:sensor histidine kinase [Candidatus Equicaccousia limihippi]